MSDKRAPKRGRPSSISGKDPKPSSYNPQSSPTTETKPSALAIATTPPYNYYSNTANPSPSFQQHTQRPSSTFSGLSPVLPSPHGQPPVGKFLLPPLPRSQQFGSLNKDKNRTAHACEKCRKAKAKCSGGMPCEKCKNENKECVYGDGKRDKQRKEMSKLQQQNHRASKRTQQVLDVLTNVKISADLAPALQKQLDALLEALISASDDEDDDDLRSPVSSQLSSPAVSPPLTSHNDRAGSTSSIDVIHEDTNLNAATRAAGFLGKSSAASWIQRANREVGPQRQLSQGSPANSIKNPGESISASAYHGESSDFPNLSVEVNALELPGRAIADVLVETYFENTHAAFPILSKQDFMFEYTEFPREPKNLNTRQQTWLTLLNLVFAISSHYSRLSGTPYHIHDSSHLIFYARARQLGIDERTLHADPEIGHISCLALLGIYLLGTDQLNRAWTVSGVAVRQAVALGLHVRNEVENLPDSDKELRVRLWWSLYSLERLLAELTGRPSCICDRDLSTPMPANLDESVFRRDTPFYAQRRLSSTSSTTTKSSSNKRFAKGKGSSGQTSISGTSTSKSKMAISSLTDSYFAPESFAFPIPKQRLAFTTSTYFIYCVSLSIVSHEILTQLYCASLVKAHWSEVQDTIRRLEARLQGWKESLSLEYDFSSPWPPNLIPQSAPEPSQLANQRAGLTMFYHSTRMTLFRPTLCRFEGRDPRESERSHRFNRDSVAACVNSARAIIAALPDTNINDKNSPNFSPRTHDFYTTCEPFWQSLHFLIEAASVIMLELAYRAIHVPGEAAGLLQDSKKAVLWLRALSNESVAARKAWEVLDQLLRKVAPRVGGVTWDMPSEAPRPRGWLGTRFGSNDGEERERERRDQMTGIQQQQYQRQQQEQASQQQQSDFHYNSTVPGPSLAPAFDAASWAPQSLQQPSYIAADYGMNMSGAEVQYGYLSSLQPSSATGSIYSQYDQFGPWHRSFLQAIDGEVEGMGMQELGIGVPMNAGEPQSGYLADGIDGSGRMQYDWSDRTNEGTGGGGASGS